MICSFLRSPRNTDVAVLSAQVRLLGLHKADMNIRGSLNQILCASTIDLFFDFLTSSLAIFFVQKLFLQAFFRRFSRMDCSTLGSIEGRCRGPPSPLHRSTVSACFSPEIPSEIHGTRQKPCQCCIISRLGVVHRVCEVSKKKHQDDCQGWCVICQCWFRKLLKSGESKFEYTIRTYTIYDNMVSFTLDKMGPLDHLSTSFARYLIVCL